jgi:amino acid permease
MIFLKAIAVFLGTVIGVGFFSLPYIASKAGFFIMAAYLLIMTIVAITVHLMYAEVCVATTKHMRLPGYAKEYLGDNWSKLAFLVIISSLLMALVPYLIVGGEFLNSIFSPYFNNGPVFYTILFFIAGSYLVFKDIRNISKAELFLLLGIIGVVVYIFFRSIPIIDYWNFSGFDKKFLFFPFGAVLFSLWGSSVIPELKEIMSIFPIKKMRRNMNMVIVLGLVITFFIYLIFASSVLGVSGRNTSKEAISGLIPFMGRGVVILGSALGVICCFTTFIAIALVLKKTLWYDFKLQKNVSWFIVCFLPLIIFLCGARDFIEIIGFVGSISIGLEAIIVIFLYNAFLKQRMHQKSVNFSYLLVAVFFVGIVLEILAFLS